MSEAEESIDVKEMVQLQLAEVEMLQSMFANPGEFTLDSEAELDELRAFVEGTIGYDALESRVGFTIKMANTSSLACKLELSCSFPHEYPSTQPSVSIRALAMTGKRHKQFSEEFYKYLASLATGELFIINLVGWLQENTHVYLEQDQAEAEAGGRSKKSSQPEGNKELEKSFMRLWVYSHHIYSKVKRQNILDWAGERDLRGFSLPGKPGVICLEGYSELVDEFWHRIRRLNWKHLAIKEQEVEDLEGREVTALCRFGKFHELELEVVGGKGRNYHMDLGQFYEFLQEHNSAYMFPLYFGVEGKSGGGGGD